MMNDLKEDPSVPHVEFLLLKNYHQKFRFFYLVYKNSADPALGSRKTFSDSEFEKVGSRISK
jgi:hypothetical protein